MSKPDFDAVAYFLIPETLQNDFAVIVFRVNNVNE